MKIRLTRPVRSFLAGTNAGQKAVKGYESGTDDPASVSLCAKVFQQGLRRDGSTIVDLTADEVDALHDYVEGMQAAARDNVGSYGPEALGEYNAASALLRQIERVRQ